MMRNNAMRVKSSTMTMMSGICPAVFPRMMTRLVARIAGMTRMMFLMLSVRWM